MARFAFYGLASILDEIAEIEKPIILDLGAMTPGYLSYYSGKKCKIYANSLGDLFVANPDITTQELDAFIDDDLLSNDMDAPFDAVLLWDLFNYFQPSSIKKLMEKLKPFCKLSTLFYTIRYTGVRIPIAPCQFDIVDQKYLAINENGLTARKVKEKSTYFLLKTMSQLWIFDGLNRAEKQKFFTEHVLYFNPRKAFNPSKAADNGGLARKDNKALSNSAVMHKSPGIRVLCQYLKKINASNLLDLGPKVEKNIDLFSRVCKQVYVEDLFSSLMNWKKIKGESAKWSFSKYALSFDASTRFDAIILWDLVNYLTLEQVEMLAKRLSPYCRQGTRIFVMVYSLQDIPSRPQRFLLQSEESVNIVPAPNSPRQQESITIATLFKHLCGFRPDGAYRLHEGMHSGIGEYLLSFQGGAQSNVIGR
jgi:hypothetical protein